MKNKTPLTQPQQPNQRTLIPSREKAQRKKILRQNVNNLNNISSNNRILFLRIRINV